jgi:hypothetical protein
MDVCESRLCFMQGAESNLLYQQLYKPDQQTFDKSQLGFAQIWLVGIYLARDEDGSWMYTISKEEFWYTEALIKKTFSKSKFVMSTKFPINIDQITDLHMHTREIQVAQFFSDKDGN